MRYIIINNGLVSYTKWFEAENHFIDGMIIIDLVEDKFTTDGITWQNIEFDHL